MGKHLDEEILNKREKIRKSEYKSIEKGYYVRGKIVYFSDKQIMKPFSMYLADNMGVMPEKFAKIKYPSEFRPKVIYTTLDLSVNMGFSLFHRKIKDEEIENICNRMMSALKREHSDYRFYGLHKMKKITGYRISFRSHAMDSDLFNMILVAQLEKQTIMGNFNCLYKEYEQWEEMIILMWETIQTFKEKETAIKA